MVLFTSRSLSHLGQTLRCLIWHLPQVFICYLLSINYIHFLQIQHDNQVHLHFTGLQYGRKGPCLVMGVPQYLPLIIMISHYVHNPVRALLPHWPNGLGGQRNPTMTLPFS